MTPFTSQTSHEAEWAQRLEEWRDGIASATDTAAIESHLPTCPECRNYLAAVESIDAELGGSLAAPALSAEFERNLWARIDSTNEIQRALAKQRLQDELQHSLAALDHRWRRKLALLVPGIFAGMVLAFWFVSLLSTSAWLTPLFTFAQAQLGPAITQLVQTIATSLLGAAVGVVMTQWVTPAAD